MKKTITILSLILCVLISGCAKSESATESGTDTETSAEEMQQFDSAPSPIISIPTETPIPTAYETETPPTTFYTPLTLPSPATTQTSVPSNMPVQTPAPSSVNTPEAATYTYSVWAESGAVITSQDSSTGEFRFKQRCEDCGEVKDGETLSFVKGGSGMTTSFTCSKCGNHQKVVIGWSCTKN